MVKWACFARFPESNLWKSQSNREMETKRAMNTLDFINHWHQYPSSSWRCLAGATIYAALSPENELAGYKELNK